MGLVRISPSELHNVALMISTVKLAENDDLEASDTIVQISHV